MIIVHPYQVAKGIASQGDRCKVEKSKTKMEIKGRASLGIKDATSSSESGKDARQSTTGSHGAFGRVLLQHGSSSAGLLHSGEVLDLYSHEGS